VSGVLGALGPPDGDPVPPLNLVADFGAGGTAAAFAIAAALFARERTGRGRYLDVSMVEGCRKMMAFHRPASGTAAMPARGVGVLGGRAPAYRTYRCRDGRYVAVGALERRSFEALWRALGFHDAAPDQDDPSTWEATARRLEAAFAGEDRDAWTRRFDGVDACVTPVLSLDEVEDDANVSGGSASGAGVSGDAGEIVDETCEILTAAGASRDEITAALGARDALADDRPAWPPPAARG
jgi:alpha-methylacyl-CoA racemase